MKKQAKKKTYSIFKIDGKYIIYEQPKINKIK